MNVANIRRQATDNTSNRNAAQQQRFGIQRQQNYASRISTMRSGEACTPYVTNGSSPVALNQCG